MKRMKSKKLNGILIASALASAIVFGGLAAGSLTNGGLKINSPSTIAHATTQGIVNSKQDGNVYYVGVGDLIDSKGKNIVDSHTEGDGASADAPMTFKTFVNDYMPNLKGGDIVKIMPGEHMFDCDITVNANGYVGTGNMIVTASGTFDNYIIFEPQDPAQKTTINFKQQSFLSTNRGVQLYGNYIYWHDIDVCGAGDNGLYIAGSYNVIERCEFYNNRDTGLQLGRAESAYANIVDWPSYNLIKNCTSYNNYDNETYGENADGFAAKLTVGYGNIFDGCIAYRNSDDGWDLYAKSESGNIGAVIIYNCVAFENGFIQHKQKECNEWYKFEKGGKEYCSYNSNFDEKGDGYDNTSTYLTRDGDGNGFKLGGGTMEGDVILYNCLAFNNRMHGVTDNSNPGVLSINNVTSYNNGATTNDVDGTVNITAKLLDEESKHNNIDIERTDRSYNNFTNILSVNNGNTRMGTDAYRGSGEYSILTANDNGSESIRILENMDADSLNNKVGEKIASPTAAELFAELPSDDLGIKNLTDRTDGLYYIHTTYREADGTINMGDLFKIISQPIAGHTIGCDLTKTSYDAYTHYEYTYLTSTEDVTGNGVINETDALLTAVRHMLYIPTNANAVYQDFNGITSLNRCSIKWTSSNPDVVKVDTNVITSSSNTTCVRLIVYRQEEEKQVTLTATIAAPNGETVTKEFNLTVKVLTVGIGDVVVNGLMKGKLITNQYSLYKLPEAVVTNSTDNNGKLLARDKYEITETYLYSTVKGGHQTEVKYFTPSTAGVYEIVYRIDLKDSNEFRIYSYNLFVVSGSAKVDFVEQDAENPDVSVGVDFNGYYITGNLNNVSGYLYTMVSDTEPTAGEVIAGGEKYQITDDYIYVNYDHDNSAAYNVYFVVCNPHGAATSKVYSSAITKVDINDETAFNELLASGGETNKIYSLNCDLNYSGKTYKVSEKSFVGYLDGNGHTISNVTINSATKDNVGVFYRLEGGTIVNLNFDNISITGRQNVGIIAAAYSGTVANIKITDVNVQSAEQRVGGLIGRMYEQVGAPMVVDRVSLINKKAGISINAGQRAAGICGFLQTNTKPTSDMVWVKISNCYIDAEIGSSTSKECGGIFGTFDTEYGVAYISSYKLEITNCVFAGSASSMTRCGGILAYHKGLETVVITNCASIGDLYHAGVAVPITTAEKNCSGILGGYPSNGKLTVIGCYAKFIEHNSSSDVTETSVESLAKSAIWKDNLAFDPEIWEFVDSGEVDEAGEMLLEAPFIKLK